MIKIWANRLIAGDQKWSSVPTKKRKAVEEELASRVASGEITQGKMDEILAA